MLNVVRRELPALLNAAVGLPTVRCRHALGMSGIPFVGSRPAVPIVTPVVLLHGYLGTAAPWVPLVQRLHAEGFVNVFTLGYDSLSIGVPQVAAELVDHVTTVITRGCWPDVHIVGHSLGGLVARYAVQLLGLDRVTRAVVTIATPHRGSPLAWFGPGPAAAQLRPGSALLGELPPLETTCLVSWAVIHAGADLVVPPPPPGEGRCLPGCGHHSILNAPELGDAVVTHLRSAERETTQTRARAGSAAGSGSSQA